MELKEEIMIAALENAIRYEGKAVMGAIVGKMLSLHPEFKTHTGTLAKEVSLVLQDVNEMELKDQILKLRELNPSSFDKKPEKKRTLPELKNAIEGKVVMRVAPFPSGPLHVGNAKPILLNDAYVNTYGGKLLLVYDDTIGSEEKAIVPAAYQMIKEGLDFLGVFVYEHPIYKSDRIPIYYEYGEKLISLDCAYVCNCKSEDMRENRKNGIDCVHRKLGIQHHLFEFKRMLAGAYNEGEAVLRLKTSMQDPNPAFRDRVLFRLSNREHPRAGLKYKVWPMLEISWAIDDYLLGVTHILRGKELSIESDMERFIWDKFGWKHPEIIYSGLLQIEGVKISKSKSQQEIKSGLYFGWDDPRTWSLQSLKRRGFDPRAIREFCLSFGLNQNEVTVPLDNLYSFNRKLIEENAKRIFFIEDPIEINVFNAPSGVAKLPIHPANAELGFRELNYSSKIVVGRNDLPVSGMVRLMDAYNVVIDSKPLFHSKEHSKFKEHGGKIIHWLPFDSNLKATVLMPDGSVKIGIIESSIRKYQVGSIVQIERFGYARIDSWDLDEVKLWFTHN